MLGYIYKITNLKNNKIYIGQHYKSDGSLTELDNTYWASGIKICKAFDKYGYANFKREILQWCDSYEELNQQEKYYISLYNATDDNVGYNIAEGGNGGNLIRGYSEDEKRAWRIKISKATTKAMNTPEVKQKLKSIVKTTEWKNNISKSLQGRKGTPMTEENKRKLSERSKGNQWGLGNKSRTGMKNTEEHNRKISEGAKKVPHTKEWNAKVSQSLKGKPKTEEHKAKLRKPKPKYKWLLPDGNIKIMDASNGSRHKDWIRLEKIEDDN